MITFGRHERTRQGPAESRGCAGVSPVENCAEHVGAKHVANIQCFAVGKSLSKNYTVQVASGGQSYVEEIVQEADQEMRGTPNDASIDSIDQT